MIEALSFTRTMKAAKEQIWPTIRALVCFFTGHPFGGKCESKAQLKKSHPRNPINIFIPDRWEARLAPGRPIKAGELQTALTWKNDLKNSDGSLAIMFPGHRIGEAIG